MLTRQKCSVRADLKPWHWASTWGSAGVPKPGSIVTLPANSSVLISACSLPAGSGSEPVYFESIVVPAGSELVFADTAIALKLRTIKVSGKLSIGSPTCRLSSSITLTFNGTRAGAVAGGDKGIFSYVGMCVEFV